MALTMSDMLKRENVQIVDSCKDWEDSVHVAVQPLVDGGYVKPEYIDGIIQNAKELGPYFVLVPDLALLHARPEQARSRSSLPSPSSARASSSRRASRAACSLPWPRRTLTRTSTS